MTLKEMKPGQSGQVLSIGESGPLKRRIMDMGITPGVAVKVVFEIGRASCRERV